MKHIVVTGFMASGKTRVGKRLAKDLKLPFVDLDKMISTRLKMTSAQVFKRFGEPFYRAMETYCVKELMNAEEKTVISLGAAFPIQKQNEEIMEHIGTVVYLRASADVIMERLRAMGDQGGSMDEISEEKILCQLKLRGPVYEKFADITVQTGIVSFDELISQIEASLAQTEAP